MPADIGAYASIEEMVLASLVVHNDLVDEFSGLIGVEHFMVPAHKVIYTALTELCSNGRRADFRTLPEYIGPLPDTEVETPQYLARMAAIAPYRQQGMDYAKELRERYTRWQIEEIANSALYSARNPEAGENADALVDRIEQKLYAINQSAKQGGFSEFSSALTQAVEYAIRAMENKSGLSGLSSGIKALDEKMGGLQASDLIIVAARPGMGKTSLATNIAYSLAKSGVSVGFFSLEMSKDQLATRVISEVARVPSSDIRRGNLKDFEAQRLKEAAASLKSIPLHIDDQPGLTLATIRSRARRLKRERGLGCIIVDYMQLMSPGTSYRGNRVQEVSEISVGLKSLAKELNVPVIALSQLSRQVESREDKRPLLSDLRESGSIEQDADVVLFVFRKEYYLRLNEPSPDSPKHVEWMADMEREYGKAELIIAKQRHGPTGTVEVRFDGLTTSFSDVFNEIA